MPVRPEDFNEFYHLFRELKYEWLQQSERYQLKCQAIFALILHKLLFIHEDEKGNRHVRSIKRYIIEHYTEDITVSLLADKLNINSVYCGALFKKSERMTIHNFLMKVRINKAAILLQSGEYTVGEVAELTGLKTFITLVTPSESLCSFRLQSIGAIVYCNSSAFNIIDLLKNYFIVSPFIKWKVYLTFISCSIKLKM